MVRIPDIIATQPAATPTAHATSDLVTSAVMKETKDMQKDDRVNIGEFSIVKILTIFGYSKGVKVISSKSFNSSLMELKFTSFNTSFPTIHLPLASLVNSSLDVPHRKPLRASN
jgi:hypothetical protein